MTQGVTLRSTVCRSFTTNLRSAASPQTPLELLQPGHWGWSSDSQYPPQEGHVS